MARALVVPYLGVYVFVTSLTIKISKSMIVQDTAMIKMSFNAFFFTAERRGNMIPVVFMF
jgi:hypothetical protein